jgi:putative membrane protein
MDMNGRPNGESRHGATARSAKDAEISTAAGRGLLALLAVVVVMSAAISVGAQPTAAERTGKLGRAEVDFLTSAAQAGHTEVEGSKLALNKGVNTQVKGFAQQMIDDHSKTGSELASLAASKGVTLPDSPSLIQKTKIKLLSARDGAGFDREYTNGIGVAAHEDALTLFQKTSREAKDADIKDFAVKTLPTLAHHLQMARDLKTVIDKESAAGPPDERKQ